MKKKKRIVGVEVFFPLNLKKKTINKKRGIYPMKIGLEENKYPKLVLNKGIIRFIRSNGMLIPVFKTPQGVNPADRSEFSNAISEGFI